MWTDYLYYPDRFRIEYNYLTRYLEKDTFEFDMELIYMILYHSILLLDFDYANWLIRGFGIRVNDAMDGGDDTIIRYITLPGNYNFKAPTDPDTWSQIATFVLTHPTLDMSMDDLNDLMDVNPDLLNTIYNVLFYKFFEQESKQSRLVEFNLVKEIRKYFPQTN